jgi:hypothetical protein
MLSFATEFPVNRVHGSQDFLNAICTWILGSPHTEFSTTDLANIPDSGEWSARKARESVNTLLWSSSQEMLAGARWLLTADDLDWETSVVFSRNESDAWVGIRTSRESAHPAARLPPARKSVVVRTLLDSLGGALDGELLVSQEPLRLANDQIALAGRVITGRAGCRLPVVYVSCGFNGDYIAIPNQLANDLSGMAHVIVEPNRSFSRRLQIEVYSENVYGGTIGVYWPDGAGRRSFFLGPELDSPLEIKRAIVDEIRIALMNRRPLVRCSWASIEEAVSKEALKALQASGSREVEKYVEIFDAESKAKDKKLKDAETEIARLGDEIRQFEGQKFIESGVTLSAGQELDMYNGEIADIVRDALQDAASRVQADSRREHVLKAILEGLPLAETSRRQREELKELLRDYRSMDRKIRKGLENLGFTIKEEGKHFKLTFHGDDRYTFALPKSGGDRRGGLNSASDISKRLF